MKNINNLLTNALCVFCFLAMTISTQAQVIDLESTTEGALLPRMTTAQRMAIATPSQSETVYDIDTKSFWYWEDMMWNELGVSEGSGIPFFDSGSSTPGLAIPDNDPVGIMDAITLTSTETFSADTYVAVCIDITHTFDDDLDINLISPSSGVTIELSTDNGVNGSNYSGTCFTTNATENITGGTSPFNGNYIPEGTFSDLIGQPIAGDWILSVVDDYSEDLGSLNSWNITFSNGVSIFAESSQSSRTLSDFDGDTKLTLDNDQIELIAKDQTLMQLDSFVRLGSWNSGYAGDSIQLLLSGTFNTGANRWLNDGYKLVIEGYDNEGPSATYPLYVKDENNNVDFYLKSQNLANETKTLAYFRGDVAIGTETLATGFALSVDGKIAAEEVMVDLSGDWPDYVFKSDYDLKTLDEVALYIEKKGHLPGVPSAKEVEDNGIRIGEMNKVLMEKVEELTLYILDQEKRMKDQESRMKEQEERIENLEKKK